MPKKGFKAITIRETVFDRLWATYVKIKDDLETQGIFSFSGYVVSRLHLFAKEHHTPFRFQVKFSAKDRFLLEDTWKKDELTEITFQNMQPYCHRCKKNSCLHIGFLYGLPQIYRVMK